MKVSESWLREWVNPEIGIEDLCEQLTGLGLEVDSVEEREFSNSGVVVGEITDIERHPSRGKLSVCQVSDGNSSRQVVCGAPNARLNLKTAYAPPSAVLLNNRLIDSVTLAGVESHGMLCSEAELGIGEDEDGIFELPSDSKLGMDLADLVVKDDRTIDIELTPNRGDCFSVRGIAREVACLNELPFQDLEVDRARSDLNTKVLIELSDPKGCPRYLGRVIEGIDANAQTPLWLRNRLLGCGLRPINPVVDVTNYVLLELGQPMHAFDFGFVSEGIDVRQARTGEQLELLDGQVAKLEPGHLLITSGDRPVALAGVMGGKSSGVSDETKSVLLECAYFDPISIMGTARSFGLQTDASTRYERGVDHNLQAKAIERATQLLLAIVGGRVGPVITAESTEHLPESVTVSITQERMSSLIGEDVSTFGVSGIFERLGMTVSGANDEWTVEVPSHRFDISIEEDLVEEVLRVHGYNNVSSRVPELALNFDGSQLDARPLYELKQHLTGLGYSEAVSYSFIERSKNALFADDSSIADVINPIASERTSMRTSMVAGLLSTTQSNRVRNSVPTRFFESGLCFEKLGQDYSQIHRIAGVISGEAAPESWGNTSRRVDFFDLKGDVEWLLSRHDISASFEDAAGEISFLHPGQQCFLQLENTRIGVCGQVHPAVTAAFDLDQQAFAFELDVGPFLAGVHKTEPVVSQFPATRRDLALILDESVSSARLETCTRESVGELLESLTIFDIYRGKGITESHKSIAMGLVLRHPEMTLDEEAITATMDKLLASLRKELGAIQR